MPLLWNSNKRQITKSLSTKLKFHYSRMLVKGPYLSCEVKTWITISYGKLKMQKLKLAMSIVLGEKVNSWQSPNVLRRLHHHSKLMYGNTYKLVSKYFKLAVYLITLCNFFSLRFVSDENYKQNSDRIKLSHQQTILCNCKRKFIQIFVPVILLGN